MNFYIKSFQMKSINAESSSGEVYVSLPLDIDYFRIHHNTLCLICPHILQKLLFSNALKNKQSSHDDLKSIVHGKFLERANTSVLCNRPNILHLLLQQINDPTDLCWNLVLRC